MVSRRQKVTKIRASVYTRKTIGSVTNCVKLITDRDEDKMFKIEDKTRNISYKALQHDELLENMGRKARDRGQIKQFQQYQIQKEYIEWQRDSVQINDGSEFSRTKISPIVFC